MYGPQNYFLTNNELYALLSLHQVRLQAKKTFHALHKVCQHSTVHV